MKRSPRMRVPLIATFMLLAGCGYNTIQTMDERVNQAQGQIQTQLQRRSDLIPNIVATVKGQANFEQETLTKVVEARSAAVSAQSAGPANAGAAAAAENMLTGALRQLFALVENYPDLKANQNVLDLQEQLTTTENQIGFSRQHYNSSVREYNTAIQTFPNVVLAGIFGFRGRDYFQIEEADEAVPVVNLET